MRRRLFFRSLIGMPAVAVAGVSPRISSHSPRLEVLSSTQCVCGSFLYIHGGWKFQRPGETDADALYSTCVNERCPQFNVPMKPPRIQVEHADPDLVRRVRAVEEVEERERAWETEVQRRIDAAEWPMYTCRPEKTLKAYGENRWICHPDDVAQLERILASVPK